MFRIITGVTFSSHFLYADIVAENISSTTKQSPKLIPVFQAELPAVTDAMLTPEYWLSKLPEPNKLIWSQEQINKYNQNNLSKGYVLNSFKLGRSVNRVVVKNYLKADLDFIRNYIKYDLQGCVVVTPSLETG